MPYLKVESNSLAVCGHADSRAGGTRRGGCTGAAWKVAYLQEDSCLRISFPERMR